MSSIEPNEELLSAYLDGELDGDALAQIESRLQSDAEFRRCCDDYRTIRESIQQLPKFTLSADFSTRVLARIQAKAARPSLLESPTEATARRELGTDARWVRRWLPWAMGALAASLIIALAIPTFRPTARVAVSETAGPKKESKDAARKPIMDELADHDPDTLAVEFDDNRLAAPEGLVEERFVRPAAEPEAPPPGIVAPTPAGDDAPAELGDAVVFDEATEPDGDAASAESAASTESASPSRSSFRYMIVNSPVGLRSSELNLAQRKLGAGMSADYLVPPSGFDEQQLIALLESRRKGELGSSRRKVDAGDLPQQQRLQKNGDPKSGLSDRQLVAETNELKQNLGRRGGHEYFQKRYVIGEKLKTNEPARCVVVETSVEEAEILLGQLDRLVTAHHVEVIPWSAGAGARIDNPLLNLDAQPSPTRSVLEPQPDNELLLRDKVVMDAEKTDDFPRRADRDKPAEIQDQSSVQVESESTAATVRTLTETSPNRMQYRFRSEARTDAQLDVDASIEMVRLVFVFPQQASTSASPALEN